MATCAKHNPAQTMLYLERCSLSNQRVSQLLTNMRSLRSLNLREMKLADDAVFQMPSLLEPPTRLQALNLRGNQLKVEGAMALAQGLIDNTSVRLLDLGNNQLGSKGVMLLCEALKGNKYLQSLFLNSNNISSDGAYAVADLLMDEKSNLMEVHLAWNLICNTGLNSLLTCLAMSNTKLKFIDLAYNFMDITVLHALRLMLERNSTLKYLSVNDLHRFNERAVESLAPSFASNQTLKMVDLKQVTREFYEYLTETVNGSRKEPIEFRRDPKFIMQSKPQRNQQPESETPAQRPCKGLAGSRSATKLRKKEIFAVGGDDPLLHATPVFNQPSTYGKKALKRKVINHREEPKVTNSRLQYAAPR